MSKAKKRAKKAAGVGSDHVRVRAELALDGRRIAEAVGKAMVAAGPRLRVTLFGMRYDVVAGSRLLSARRWVYVGPRGVDG